MSTSTVGHFYDSLLNYHLLTSSKISSAFLSSTKSVPPSLWIQASIWFDNPLRFHGSSASFIHKVSKVLPQDDPQNNLERWPPRLGTSASALKMLKSRYARSLLKPHGSDSNVSANLQKVIAMNSTNCEMQMQRTFEVQLWLRWFPVPTKAIKMSLLANFKK